LTSAVVSQGPSTLASWTYGYDLAGNRTREDQNGTKRIESSVSVTNALTTQLDKSLPGLTTIGSRSYTHDANGNLTGITEGGVTTTLVWDAADRLISIKKGNLESRFSYDYMNRWVKIVELNGTTVTSTKDFIWCGLSLCEERSGTQVTRYYSFGFQDPSGAKFYYTRDHLGSVREVRDAGGVVVSRYRYDPYGVRTLVSGSDKSQFGFTGHYLHKTSGLLLAPYRAYSPSLGRWMSRDPIGERGGLNLYGYVRASPVVFVDPNGATPVLACAAAPAACVVAGGMIADSIISVAAVSVAVIGSWWAGNEIAHLIDPNLHANPFKGEPGTTVECPGKKGRKQTRRYAADGYPEVDTDWDHDHGQGKPHVHEWGRPGNGDKPEQADRGEGRPPRKGDPGFE